MHSGKLNNTSVLPLQKNTSTGEVRKSFRIQLRLKFLSLFSRVFLPAAAPFSLPLFFRRRFFPVAASTFFLPLPLLLATHFTSAQVMNIGLFRSSQLSAVLISPSVGEYKILGDSVEVGKLSTGNSLKIVPDSGKIKVISLAGILGTYNSVVFVSPDSSSDLKVKGIVPGTKEKLIIGHLQILPEGHFLKLINKVFLEEYISGVVESESGHGHKADFYKVQAIISRTYALANMHKHQGDGFHLCDQVHCQAYKGKCKTNMDIHKAAFDTRGIVIVDDSLKLITAAFHSNCGGQTANSESVWSKPLPYLRSVRDNYCIAQPNAIWRRELPISEWISYLKKYNFPVHDSSCVSYCTSFQQSSRQACLTSCDRSLKFANIRMDFKFKSAFFSVEPLNATTLLVRGRGFGHGVGLCQEGAMKMAKLGFDYKTILKHYFTAIHIVDMRSLEKFTDQ